MPWRVSADVSIREEFVLMASQFFTCIEAEAQTAPGEPPPAQGFFRTALRWFSGWLRRIFRK